MVVKYGKMTKYCKTFNSVSTGRSSMPWPMKQYQKTKLQHLWVSSHISSERNTDTDYADDFGIFIGSEDKLSSYQKLCKPISLYLLKKGFIVQLFSALKL